MLVQAASVLRGVDKVQKAAHAAGVRPASHTSLGDTDEAVRRGVDELEAFVSEISVNRGQQNQNRAFIDGRRRAIHDRKGEIAALDEDLSHFFTRLVDWFQRSRRRQKREELAALVTQLGVEESNSAMVLAQLAAAERDALAAAAVRAGRLQATVAEYIVRVRRELPLIEECLAALPLEVAGGWDDSRWRDWPLCDSAGKAHVDTMLAPVLRYGDREEAPATVMRNIDPLLNPVANGMSSLRLPLYVPFIGSAKSLLVTGDPTKSLMVIQSLVMRAAVLLGQQIRFTLLDPHGLGQAFPMQRFLSVRKSAADVSAEIRDVEHDIRRVNQEVLASEEGLHHLDPTRLASEHFELIVAANFPRAYDRRAVESLFRIAQSGPRAGRYVVFHHDSAHELPREMSFKQIDNLVVVNVDQDVESRLDQMPSTDERQRLLESIRSAKGVEHAIDARALVVPSAENWWQGVSRTAIATPIGVRGATDCVEIAFGVHNGVVCAHGAIAAMTGSGKSSLIHVMVLGLATRYGPDELRMYLIDGKKGAELSVYEGLPHAEVIALESPAEMSRSVLEELVREMTRRNALFVTHQVQDIGAFRDKVGPLPRLLLLIDEYQTLFEDDRQGEASENLRKLATQGRSAGIHMLLGSHRFGAPGMLHHKDIFGNVHLKIGMKMETSDIAALTEFGPLGKQLLRGCDMPGKFAVNVTGRDEETISGKAALLQVDVREQVIQELVARGDGRRPVVFQGDADHYLSANPAYLAAVDVRSDRKQREARAREHESHGGWGQRDWVEADNPIAFWLGRRPNIHGHAMVVLRRTVEQNLAVIADNGVARAGMISALLRSLGRLYSPDEVVVRMVHAGPDDHCPTVAAADVGHLIEAGFDARSVREPQHAVNVIEELLVELDRRLANPQAIRTAPAWVWVVVDPDRAVPLRRSGDPLGRGANPRSEQIRKLLEQGPPNGMHFVTFAAAFRLLCTVIEERRDLVRFCHRVGSQMSEDDSFALFRSRQASQLQQRRGSGPTDANYFNHENSRNVKFRPYMME